MPVPTLPSPSLPILAAMAVPVPVPLIVSFPPRVQMKPPVKISIPIAKDAFNSSPIKVSEPAVPMKLGGTVSLGIIKILSI